MSDDGKISERIEKKNTSTKKISTAKSSNANDDTTTSESENTDSDTSQSFEIESADSDGSVFGQWEDHGPEKLFKDKSKK